MTLSARHLKGAAYIVGQELARRQRHNIPIPQYLRDLYPALLREVSESGHVSCQTRTGPAELETTAQIAKRLGISERTVRRHAARNGIKPIAGRYLFERN